MTPIDWSILINWIVSGAIALVFGVIGALVAHRYQVKRDNVAWQREKEKLREQFDHEKELLEIQHQKDLENAKLLLEMEFQQKRFEMQQQEAKEENEKLRKKLTEGIDNPEVLARALVRNRGFLRARRIAEFMAVQTSEKISQSRGLLRKNVDSIEELLAELEDVSPENKAHFRHLYSLFRDYIRNIIRTTRIAEKDLFEAAEEMKQKINEVLPEGSQDEE